MARFIFIVVLFAVVSLSYSGSEAKEICKGGPHDNWLEVNTNCELTCENTSNTTCALVPNFSACRCELSYVRRADGMCVLKEECGNVNGTGVESGAKSDIEGDLETSAIAKRASRSVVYNVGNGIRLVTGLDGGYGTGYGGGEGVIYGGGQGVIYGGGEDGGYGGGQGVIYGGGEDGGYAADYEDGEEGDERDGYGDDEQGGYGGVEQGRSGGVEQRRYGGANQRRYGGAKQRRFKSGGQRRYGGGNGEGIGRKIRGDPKSGIRLGNGRLPAIINKPGDRYGPTNVQQPGGIIVNGPDCPNGAGNMPATQRRFIIRDQVGKVISIPLPMTPGQYIINRV